MFSYLHNTYKLKETYYNKPIVSLKKYMIPKGDILTIDKSYSNLDYIRKIYRFTDLEGLQLISPLSIDDGKKVVLDYYKRVLENRKKELSITHKEIQEFSSNLISILKEDVDLVNYMLELGYSRDVVVKAIDSAEEILETCLLQSDPNSVFVKNVILKSEKIIEQYKVFYERIYFSENQKTILALEREIKAKKDELESISREINTLTDRLAEIRTEVEIAEKKHNATLKELATFDTELEQKVTDYVLNHAFLSKLLTPSTSLSNNRTISNIIYTFIEGEDVDRKKVSYSNFILNTLDLPSMILGLASSEREEFMSCVLNTIYLKYNYVIDSYYAEDFANFLSRFVGTKSYSTLIIDDNVPISEFNFLEKNNEVILVKNSLQLINTKYIDFLTNKYKNNVFIFEIEEPKNLKYLPKYIWKKLFYVYYGFKKISSTKDVSQYYELELNYSSYTTKNNIDITIDALNIDVDDENYLGFYLNEVHLLLKTLNLYSNKTQKMNIYYIPYIVLFFASLDLDLSNLQIENKALNDYLSSILSE